MIYIYIYILTAEEVALLLVCTVPQTACSSPALDLSGVRVSLSPSATKRTLTPVSATNSTCCTPISVMLASMPFRKY